MTVTERQAFRTSSESSCACCCQRRTIVIGHIGPGARPSLASALTSVQSRVSARATYVASWAVRFSRSAHTLSSSPTIGKRSIPSRAQVRSARRPSPTSITPRRTCVRRVFATSASARWGMATVSVASLRRASPAYSGPRTAAEASTTITQWSVPRRPGRSPRRAGLSALRAISVSDRTAKADSERLSRAARNLSRSPTSSGTLRRVAKSGEQTHASRCLRGRRAIEAAASRARVAWESGRGDVDPSGRWHRVWRTA